MKKVISILILAAVMVSAAKCATFAATGFTHKTSKAGNGYITKFYSDGRYVGKVRTHKRVAVKVVKSKSLSARTLTSRRDRHIVVEVIAGKCLDGKGNGKTTDGHYINYKRVRGHKRGAAYTTYLVYGNDNSIDNVVLRGDIRK